MKQQHLESLKPDDGLVGLQITSEKIEALGLNDIRQYLLDELTDDLRDVESGELSIRALRYVLRILKCKREWQQRSKNSDI